MAISENSIAVWNYMMEHDGEDIVASDIMEALGLSSKSVTGIINAFCRKGKDMMYREEHEMEVDGKVKVIKFIRLTDVGRSFDPHAATEQE